MTIEDFLETLQERDLVPESIVKQVRDKVAQGDRRITPKSLLKFLVKKEYVTKRQAKQLLETTLTVSPHAESSILGMGMTPRVPPKIKPPVRQGDEDIPTLAPIDEKATRDESSSSLVTDEGSSIGKPDLFGDKPSSLVSESLSKIGAVDATLTDAIQENTLTPDEPSSKRGKKKRKKESEWDSSLLLLGGGGLILLITAGVIIGYLLMREDADAVLAEAGKHYAGGSYTQAIHQYERFVENHTKHPEFSAAKVNLGLAKLWKATSSTTDFSNALSTAQDVLREIEEEEAFSNAQGELASLLRNIAEGLANQAEAATEPTKVTELVKLSDTALSYYANTKYVPTNFRDEAKLAEIDQTLQRVERSRAQNAGLAQALADMQVAIDGQDTAKAYQLHDKLLDDFPGLVNNNQLTAKVLEISTAEAAVVKYVEDALAAETQPRPSNVVAELTLAHRSGPTVATDEGVAAVRISGAVYGLNLKDGAVRWRRFVGMAPRQTPVALPTGDLLIVDQQNNELLKLEGATGSLIWRLPFESTISKPVLVGDRALVTEYAGKLHVIDVASGQRSGYVQFAQQLPAPPTVGPQGKRVYLAGEHSSLYTLSTDDFSCLGVFFLNHSRGSVTTPPVVVLNKVVVAVAKGLSTSRLEVINTTANGIAHQRATNRRLDGLVNSALLSEGRRLVVVTSQGQVAVFEVGSDDSDGALTAIATRESESGPAVARFGLLHEGHVWVAGNRLSKLKILPTSDRLPVSTIDNAYQGATFDHPLQAVGDVLIHVRRPEGKAGARVAAMTMSTGAPKWETELAEPPTGPPAIDPVGNRFGVMSASGSAYVVDRQAMSQRVLNQAEQLKSSTSLGPLDQSLDLGEGRLVAAASGGKTLLHFRPEMPRSAVQAINLVGPASCAPVLWGDGFVVPTQSGQVYLYTSDEGRQWGSPFQPPLAPGETYDWNCPAVYGSGDDSHLVLSDGKKKIYLLNRAATPRPHLTASASADISTSPLATRLVVVGDLALAGTNDGSLAVFELPSLAAQPTVDLQAQVIWGPFSLGQSAVLATSTEELVCLDNQAKIVWRQPLAHGSLAGEPLARDGEIVVLWQQGGLSQLNLTDGAETAFVPLPQPVIAGPVAFSNRLVVSSYDGTLLVVDGL